MLRAINPLRMICDMNQSDSCERISKQDDGSEGNLFKCS